MECVKFTKGKASLHLAEDASPVFCKSISLPHALREKVESELDRLIKLQVLEPVEFSDWATPIVAVLKKNGQVRICGDFRITVNPKLNVAKYPLLKIEDLLQKIANCLIFSKLDLSQAYAQIELSPESKQYVTINTHKNLYRYNRLPYGIAFAPAIFQRIIDQSFAQMPGVIVFLDDILIAAKNTQQHLQILIKVFEKLQECGLKVQLNKCEFMKSEIEYLCHTINKEGIHTSK